MIRKAVSLLTVLLLFTVTGGAVNADIVVESFSPHPAEPGDTVKMQITVENKGDHSVTFDALSVETVDGVRVIGTTDTFRERFTLCSGCRQVGTIHLKVDEDAVSGTYPIDIELTHGNTGIVEKTELIVDGTPKLSIDVAPVSVVPGTNATARITVENVGTDTATATTLAFSGDGFGMYPTTLTLGAIPAGDSVTRTVSIEADGEATHGLKQATLAASYRDESRTHRTETGFSITVLRVAELALSDFSVDEPVIGAATTVTVQVENLGPGEATNIKSEMSCAGATMKRDKDFVGQLDDEESVPLTFRLTPRSSEIKCTIDTAYRDRSARTTTASFGFSATERQRQLPFVIAGLVIVVAVYIFWRRRNDEAAAV